MICELARKNPKNYLPLAPVFFKLMTSSTNNWMLIKIIKLVSSPTLPPLSLPLDPTPPSNFQLTTRYKLTFDTIINEIPVWCVDALRTPTGPKAQPAPHMFDTKVTISFERHETCSVVVQRVDNGAPVLLTDRAPASCRNYAFLAERIRITANPILSLNPRKLAGHQAPCLDASLILHLVSVVSS